MKVRRRPIPGTYTQQPIGSLRVTISPQGAIDAGAQWRRWGRGTWHDSGTTQTGISVGQHTVEFSDVAGWTKPGNQTVTISEGQTTNTSGTYTQHDGFLASDDQSPGGDRCGGEVASCGDEHMAGQRDHGDRNSGGSAYGRVQRCSGLDEARQSDSDDQ